jgi:hypothetical protein
MSATRRLGRLEGLWRTPRPPCRTCWGTAALVVAVPDPDNADQPEYNPTHCPECRIPSRSVRQILGMTEEELP